MASATNRMTGGSTNVISALPVGGCGGKGGKGGSALPCRCASSNESIKRHWDVRWVARSSASLKSWKGAVAGAGCSFVAT